MTEHQEQVNLFCWAKLLEDRHPQLKWMFSIPNAGKRKSGWWEKAEGLKKGVHDIFLPVPRETYSGKMIPGLWIEMKFKKNKLTKEQEEFKTAMDAEGYQTVTCWSFLEAKKAIIDYLGLEVK